MKYRSFVHWVIYNIPGTAVGLPEAIAMGAMPAGSSEIAGAIQGLSGFNRRGGEPGDRGPTPPPGNPHHYHFTVYALDADLGLKEGLDKTGSDL